MAEDELAARLAKLKASSKALETPRTTDDDFALRLKALRPSSSAAIPLPLDAVRLYSSASSYDKEQVEQFLEARDGDLEDADDPQDLASALKAFDLLSTPSGQPKTAKRPWPSGGFEDAIQVQFALKPEPERSQEEEDRLIAQLQEEIKVEASAQPQEGDMESRLSRLKDFKVAPASSASRDASVEPLAPPPIFDPYEFELAASGSEESSDDGSDSDASAPKAKRKGKKAR